MVSVKSWSRKGEEVETAGESGGNTAPHLASGCGAAARWTGKGSILGRPELKADATICHRKGFRVHD